MFVYNQLDDITLTHRQIDENQDIDGKLNNSVSNPEVAKARPGGHR